MAGDDDRGATSSYPKCAVTWKIPSLARPRGSYFTGFVSGPDECFAAVAEETARCLDVAKAEVFRYMETPNVLAALRLLDPTQT